MGQQQTKEKPSNSNIENKQQIQLIQNNTNRSNLSNNYSSSSFSSSPTTIIFKSIYFIKIYSIITMLVEQIIDKISSTIIIDSSIKQNSKLIEEIKENNEKEEQNDSNNNSLSEEEKEEENNKNEFKNFELKDLKTITTLGIGGFGRVNLVQHIDRDNIYFALKILNKQHIKNKNQIEHVQNERNILMECNCDFIVKLYKTFRDSEKVYMLMEYCPGGDLWTVLRSFLRLDEKKAKYYCAAALEAFDYLHKRLIIYRDLKPENMLLDINGIPKLVDFGFAKRLPTEMDKAWTFCGTTEYVAPEIILGEGQDSAVDIWSLGIFLFEMLTGNPPFVSSEPMLTYNAIIKGVQNLTFPRYISDNARLLIFKLCRKKSTQRLGYGHIEDLRKDIWFDGFDFNSFRNHTMRPPIRPKVLNLTDTRNFDQFPLNDDFACGLDDDGWDEDF